MNFFKNLTISRSLINLYGLQVSMSLKTYKVIKLGIERTSFFSQISRLQASVLLFTAIVFKFHMHVNDFGKKLFALNRTLDCFPKNFPKTFPNALIWLENCNTISQVYYVRHRCYMCTDCKK